MIPEDQVSTLLRAAGDDIDVASPPAQALADAGNKRRRQHRIVVATAGATAVALVAIAVPWVAASRSSDSPGPAGQPTNVYQAAECTSPVPSAVLPTWARAGFSDPRPRIPYITSASGNMLAILFVQPLTSPPSDDHNNKVLWVSRLSDPGPFTVTASLADGTTRTVNLLAPGPSIVDLPKPGCWHLTFDWGGQSDSLDLQYDSPS